MSSSNTQNVRPPQSGSTINQQQQPQVPSLTRILPQLLLWAFLIYTFFNRKSNNKTVQTTDSNGNKINFQRPNHFNLWKKGTNYQIRLYLSENIDRELALNENNLLWKSETITYTDDTSKSYKEMNYTIKLNESTQNNGFFWRIFVILFLIMNSSMYGHIILHDIRYTYDIDDDDYEPKAVIYIIHPIIVFKRLIIKKKINLLSGESKNENKNNKSLNLIIGHWKPEITIRPLVDWTVYKDNSIPEVLLEDYTIDDITNGYWPIIYMDDFWLLKQKYIPINETINEVPLKIIHNPITQWKYMFQISMDKQQKKQNEWSNYFGAEEDSGKSDAEQDTLRKLLLESNPYLLGVTMIVSILHSLFDFLAFKNDIQFWRKKKSGGDMTGLSIKTIFVNCFCQLIIFLYLWEQNTTWMILISSGIGLCIEFWKITQAADVKYSLKGNKYFNGPWVSITDRKSYIESSTAKYDRQAMKYLSYVIYPLMIGYSIYSLIYNEHSGWYNFILKTLVSFIYMFGFIMMCPQLYLNYKLKSVAHLPWRMMTYKFLNTIIDDLFAFVMPMPTMHRLSCFRDDVIFLIFLYQKWIYPTDYARTNEYGYNPDEVNKLKNEALNKDKSIKENESDKNNSKNGDSKNESNIRQRNVKKSDVLKDNLVKSDENSNDINNKKEN